MALVVLASAGVDALRLATEHKQRFDRALGWGLIAIGTSMLYGYSGMAQARLIAVMLMIAPVLAYHRMNRSPWPHAGARLVATIVGLQLVYLVLVNLP